MGEQRVSWWNQESDGERHRAAAAEAEAVVTALESLRTDLAEQSVRDSPFEGLFDEVTTANPSLWNRVTAFIEVEDGEAVVTEESKLAQGKWAPEIVDDCDAMVTLEVQRGLMPDDFTYLVERELADEIERLRAEAADHRQAAAEHEESAEEP